jgi:hypothetical protein
MKAKVRLNSVNTIKVNLGINPGGKAEAYLTNMLYRRMGPFVPGGSSSELNKNVYIETGAITYKSPYAHYQYRSILYVDPQTGSSWARKGVTKVPTNRTLHHTLGTSYWDKEMWASQKDDALKELQEYVDRGCK